MSKSLGDGNMTSFSRVLVEERGMSGVQMYVAC